MMKVTLYCHDRNEEVYSEAFNTWREAKAFFMEQAKRIHINTSIYIGEASEDIDGTLVIGSRGKGER